MASTFSKLKIELIGTGDQSGTWGATTNNNLGSSSTYRGLEQAIVGMATLVTGDFTTNSYTLPYTDSNDDQDFRCLVLDITATLTGAGTVIVPAIQKPYIVMNNSVGGYAVTVKVSGQTGISVPNGAKVLLYNNGTDVGTAVTYLTSLTLGSALGVASGGTGLTSGTSGGIPYFSSTSAMTSSAALAANALVIGGGAGVAPATTTTGTGVVTAIGNNTNAANGLAVLGAGGALAVAQGGTGITSGTSGGIPYFSSSSAITSSAALVANAIVIGGGAGVAPSTTTTGTGVITALGVNVGSSGAFTTNNAANTFTAKQTFTGSTSVLASALRNIAEPATVSATAATGTINYDVTTQSVLYYTSNASANWTVNFRASSGTSLNTAMNTGDAITVAFLVTQGSTAYYNSAVQVDGSSVTPKYQGGTAWSAGNASGIDAYTYTIVKTASATFTVFASQTRFA